jgi:hypothetical protein
MKTLAFAILTIIAFTTWSCATQKITRENIEWSDFWWGNEGDKTKPRVLFVGNSITRGYYAAVSTKLAEKANCDRYATSRSLEDPALFKETKMAMGKYNHAVIHFNNGLHGWHLNNEQYEKGLKKYVRFLKRHKTRNCKLVYSLTTPVPSSEEGVKLDPVRNEVVLQRNQIAMKIMQENGVQVIDLYGLMEPELEILNVSKGNVHYKKEGNDRMAGLISEEVLKLLEK